MINLSKHKHFTLSERIDIERLLNDTYSFKSIARELSRDCTSIAKEVKNHIIRKKIGSFGQAYNSCLKALDCSYSHLCDSSDCKNRFCRFCSRCSSNCSDYLEKKCKRLLKPPYVCNGCKNRKGCRLEKLLYSASSAQREYETLRTESRTGINIIAEELHRIDTFVSPLLKQGQSIHHVCSNNKDTIMCSEKTIYNYVEYSLFSARNLDLPRKVRYRPRKKHTNSFKVDKSCRLGRTYLDFNTFLEKNPDIPVVEMDSVEGVKGGKLLLTIHFREPQFMLAFLRDANTSQSVIDIFDKLYKLLTPDVFGKLFPVILTDNGSEFSNPSAIEFDKLGNRRTQIFYCDPSAPHQKGAVENNHELIRRIVPKGISFNDFTQKDITLMMNHINSYGRKKLNDHSPHCVFDLLFGKNTLKKLGAVLIPSNKVILTPKLFR